MKSPNSRLRQHRRDDARPIPVYLTYGRGMTSREALAAAIAAGKVPAKAAIVLMPQRAASNEEWERDCQAEEAKRQRAEVQKQQEAQSGIKPAGQAGSA